MKYNFLLIFLLGISLFSNSQNYKCYDGYFCDNGYAIVSKEIVYWDTTDSVYKMYDNVFDIPVSIEDFIIWNVSCASDTVSFTILFCSQFTSTLLEVCPVDCALSHYSDPEKNINYSVEEAMIFKKTKVYGFDRTHYKIGGKLAEITFSNSKFQTLKLKKSDKYTLLIKNIENRYALVVEIATEDKDKIKQLLRLPPKYYIEGHPDFDYLPPCSP
jgi:hypothetical protein